MSVREGDKLRLEFVLEDITRIDMGTPEDRSGRLLVTKLREEWRLSGIDKALQLVTEPEPTTIPSFKLQLPNHSSGLCLKAALSTSSGD